MPKPSGGFFRWRGKLGLAVLPPAFIIAGFSPAIFPEGSPADLVLSALGWAAFVAGAILRFWATIYIGGYKGHRVVCQGPYSLCRHPLYVGAFLIVFSAAVMLGSVTALAAVLLTGLIYYFLVIPAEEEHMAEQLGEEYRLYCQSTPRVLLRIRKPVTPDYIEIKVRSLWLELKRSAVWLLIPIGCEVMGTLRSSASWPHLFNLP